MDVLKPLLFCAVAIVPLTLLKKYAVEQAILLIAAVMMLVIYRCLACAVPLLETFESLMTRAGIEGEYISVLLRSVGASLVTRLCADLCRDGGSHTLATLSEIAGIIASLLISMPVINAVAELLLGYLG